MKTFLRSLVYCSIGFWMINYFLGNFRFSDQRLFFVVLLAAILLNTFLRPLLSFVNLPSMGPIFWVLSAILNFIIFQVLSVVLPGFFITKASTPSLLILGVVITSKDLKPLWASVFASALFSCTYLFMVWLSGKKK